VLRSWMEICSTGQSSTTFVWPVRAALSAGVSEAQSPIIIIMAPSGRQKPRPHDASRCSRQMQRFISSQVFSLLALPPTIHQQAHCIQIPCSRSQMQRRIQSVENTENCPQVATPGAIRATGNASLSLLEQRVQGFNRSLRLLSVVFQARLRKDR
jgi:hypothetical protein